MFYRVRWAFRRVAVAFTAMLPRAAMDLKLFAKTDLKQEELMPSNTPMTPSSSIGWQVFDSAVSMGKTIGVPYLLALFALYAAQRSLIYPIPIEKADPTLTGGQLHTLECTDQKLGPRIAMLYFPPPNPGAPVLVYFHGNGDQIGWGSAELGSIFTEYGCGFFAVEYPGYGLARGGTPSEQGLYEVSLRGLEFLTSSEGLNVDKSRIVLFGQSIGGGVAVELANRGWGSRLVLLSAFTSLPAMAQQAFGVFTRVIPLSVLNAICQDQYDNLSKAPKIAIPTCVLHGDSDEIVPFQMGQTLAKAIPAAIFHTVPKAGHNDIFVGRAGDLVFKTVADFAKAAKG